MELYHKNHLELQFTQKIILVSNTYIYNPCVKLDNYTEDG